MTRLESVFQTTNHETQFTRFGIDKSGLQNPSRWTSVSGIGKGADPYGTWDAPEHVGHSLNPGKSFTVEIQLDTRGSVNLITGVPIVRSLMFAFYFIQARYQTPRGSMIF